MAADQLYIDKDRLVLQTSRPIHPGSTEFWDKVILLRYNQLENGDTNYIVDNTDNLNHYEIITRELSEKGVVYENRNYRKTFNNIDADFKLGQDDDLLIARQLNGKALNRDTLINNTFFFTRVRGQRIEQINNGMELVIDDELAYDLSDTARIVEAELEKGIMVNGEYYYYAETLR